MVVMFSISGDGDGGGSVYCFRRWRRWWWFCLLFPATVVCDSGVGSVPLRLEKMVLLHTKPSCILKNPSLSFSTSLSLLLFTMAALLWRALQRRGLASSSVSAFRSVKQNKLCLCVTSWLHNIFSKIGAVEP
ncbi:hypothetical protein QL285_034776 [Trifolium repens]|nr:hypothetical protein QL285_034776 [Trifolium repens]